MRCLFGLLAVFVCSIAVAQDGTWKYREGVGLSVASMLEWDDPDNWEDGIVAGGANSLATFPTTIPESLSGKSLWVHIPDQYTLGSVVYHGKSLMLNLVGETIRMCDKEGGVGHVWKSARFFGTSDDWKFAVWADAIIVDGDFSFYHNYIYAPISANKFTCSSTTYIMVGSFATSAEENVSDLYEAQEWNPSQQILFSNAASSPACTTSYVLTKGKSLVKYSSGSSRPVAGALVVSEGLFPPGTFVKRNYNNTYMEMSAPALVSSDSEAGTAVSFRSFSLKYTQHISNLTPNEENGGSGIVLEPDANTELTADIVKVSGSNPLLFYSNNNYFGTYNLRDISSLTAAVARNNSLISFLGVEGSDSDELRELRFTTGAGRKTYGTARLSVPEGRIVTVKKITPKTSGVAFSTATIAKYGAGDLVVNSTEEVNPAISVYDGSIVFDASAATSPTVAGVTVDGGVFSSRGAVSLGAVKVKAGGAYRVTANDEATYSSLVFNSGSMLDIAEGASPNASDYTFPDGIGFRLGKNVSFNPGTVTLNSDSVIELSEGSVLTLDDTVVTTEGITVRGPGEVVLSKNTPVKHFVITGGAILRIPSLAGITIDSDPVPEVVGHPAFWVDASVFTNASVLAACVEDGYVKRWNDVRDGEDMYAYKNGTRPKLVKNAAMGMPKVKFDRVDGVASDATIDNFRCMIWNREITGIRAVFLVEDSFDNGHGGGIILGATPGAGYNDFSRFGFGTWSKPFVTTDSVVPACVQNGVSYVYGHRGVPTKQCFNGAGGVQLVELHPLAPGARANAFAIGGGDNAANGCMNICECIVYTNELTYAERAKVAQYLHKKWISPDTSVYYDPVSPDGTLSVTASPDGSGFDISSGSVIAMETLSGEGTFIKRGEGELRLTDMTNSLASLSLEAGITTIRSYEPTADDLPANAFIRLDSTAKETLRLNGDQATMPVGEEKTRVNIWRDANGGAIRARRRASGYPNWYLVNEGPNGESVVDFGKCIVTNNSWKVGEGGRYMMQFGTSENVKSTADSIVAVTNARSVFMVWGSKYGGNQITGSYDNLDAIGMERDAKIGDDAAKLLTYPIIRATASASESMKTEWRKNGVKINPSKSYLSGTWDVVSYNTPFTGKPYSFDAIAWVGAGRLGGGMQIGEFIVYTNVISYAEYRAVDAYLNRKWFNRRLPGFRQASIGALAVKAGATLKVDGNTPLKVSSIDLSQTKGTVIGKLSLSSEGGEITVRVNDDGSITPTTIGWDVDLSAGGAIRLVGNVAALKIGTYDILTAPGSKLEEGEWSVVNETTGNYFYKVWVSQGKLRLSYCGPGMMLIFR